jgi:hypothetical protein
LVSTAPDPLGTCSTQSAESKMAHELIHAWRMSQGLRMTGPGPSNGELADDLYVTALQDVYIRNNTSDPGSCIRTSWGASPLTDIAKTCACVQTFCTGTPNYCSNLNTDVNNCGSCGNSCDAAGANCVSGNCGCANLDDTYCGAAYGIDPPVCTDMTTDPNHCSQCYYQCPTGMPCMGSSGCTCGDGNTYCGNACCAELGCAANTTNTADPGVTGQCCPTGQIACNGGTPTNANCCPSDNCAPQGPGQDPSCGSCSTACGGVNDAGTQDVICCGSGCVDILSDPNNCGGCGNSCQGYCDAQNAMAPDAPCYQQCCVGTPACNNGYCNLMGCC